jgi:predicted enzyme related to lactoylglutathione lyase
MALVAVDHLNVASVFVDDLDRAVSFYVETLGFEKTRAMDPGVLLHAKGPDLTLYVEGGRKASPTPAGERAHVSLCFNAAQGVKAALAAIERAQIPVVGKYGDFEGRFAGFQFTDPSGNVIEIAGQP